MENSPPKKMKSMLGAKEEAGEIQSPEKSLGEASKETKGVSGWKSRVGYAS